LTLFGLVAVTAMLVCYALEEQSYLYILGFALSCSPGSASGFLEGAWRSARSSQSGRLSPCVAGIAQNRSASSSSGLS
jgi:hypothetical protein